MTVNECPQKDRELGPRTGVTEGTGRSGLTEEAPEGQSRVCTGGPLNRDNDGLTQVEGQSGH